MIVAFTTEVPGGGTVLASRDCDRSDLGGLPLSHAVVGRFLPRLNAAATPMANSGFSSAGYRKISPTWPSRLPRSSSDAKIPSAPPMTTVAAMRQAAAP